MNTNPLALYIRRLYLMKKIFAAALISLSLAAAAAQAQDVVVSQENLTSVLSGYHGMPGPDYWARLEPVATRATLTAIADDSSAFVAVRARALMALAYFNDESVSAYLESKVKNEPEPYVRSAACSAVARARGEKAVPLLSEALEDSEVIVRLSAVRSLSAIGTDEARNALKSRLSAETNTTAKSVITHALEQMR